jgi:PTS system D-glucosamine-specific IIC component
MLMHILGVGVGMTFSGGLIDMTLFGIMQGNAKTNWIYIVVVGIVYFIVYYLLFSFLIKKLDLKTPGREDGDGEVKLYKRSDLDAKNGKGGNAGEALSEDDMISAIITDGLGGKSNISDLDCCATRLRVTVKDNAKVKQDVLKSSGASGVVVKGNGVQVIYGPKVTVIKSNLEDYLEHASDVPVEVTTPAVEEKKEEVTANHKKDEKNAEDKKETVICSPFTGKAMELSEVADGVFSEKMLGNGIAVEPEEGTIMAPFDGTIAAVFDTKHAIGLVSDTGLELLIHIGIDTVQLNGKYYDIKVKNGDQIKKGDVIGTVDLEGIRSEGYRTITPIIVSNTDNYNEFKEKTGTVTAGEEILVVK